jgi:DNA polymerase
MALTLSLDYETYSDLGGKGLKGFGQYRYACDPSTEILCLAIAEHDKEPALWLCNRKDNAEAMRLLELASKGEAIIYAHNAPFEIAITKYLWEKTFGIPAPKLEQWRCTAALCRRAAIPHSLEAAGDFLNLETVKDKRGKQLLNKFSQPRKPTKKDPRTRIMPDDEPEEFYALGEYCLQDVRVEKLIHEKLARFELEGINLQAFQFDLRMNERGVPVNTEALSVTKEFVDEYDERLTARFREITGLNPTQRDKVLQWLQKEGFPGKNMQAATVEKVLGQDPSSYGFSQLGYEALELKSYVGFAALKKVNTMLNAACPDGRVRGTLMWSGAIRTHRWAGRIIQPQNFRRPTVNNTDCIYSLIQENDFSTVRALHWEPLEAIASCIRHFIQNTEGQFLDADYSAIEARINPWLCGAESKLELFRKKAPIYERMGARIFGKTVEEVIAKKKSEIWRFVGKQAELGCGYNMGDAKFQQTCANYGQDISFELAQKAVKAWRTDETNIAIVRAWKTIDQAAKQAILNPGKVFWGTKKLAFQVTNRCGFPALVLKLPSGHCLIYPRPRVLPVLKKFRDSEYETEEIQFWGKVSTASGGEKWGWVSTYGGKLLENATQAVAGDVMTHGALVAETRGFQIFMLVHDQALAERLKGQTPEAFAAALCELPDWAEGLPIEAEAAIQPYYVKD